MSQLESGLVDALHGFLPSVLERRAWDIAIDLHYVPFYGDRKTPGVLGGPKKGGTHRFFVYASAVLVHRGQRWCVALTACPNTRWDVAVKRLIDQLQARHIRVRCLIFDRGFFSGHVILALQERRLPFIVGVPRWEGFRKFFKQPTGKVTAHRWKTERGNRPVEVSMILAHRRVRNHWRTEVYAFGNITPEGAVRRYQRARFYRELNQRRFGIETCFRQMKQSQVKTTTCDQRQRLLWLAVALLLRQVWLFFQQKLAPFGTRWSHWEPTLSFPLKQMLDWLAESLRQLYQEMQQLDFPQPMQRPRMKAHKP